jgi:hypothetical protein
MLQQKVDSFKGKSLCCLLHSVCCTLPACCFFTSLICYDEKINTFAGNDLSIQNKSEVLTASEIVEEDVRALRRGEMALVRRYMEELDIISKGGNLWS